MGSPFIAATSPGPLFPPREYYENRWEPWVLRLTFHLPTSRFLGNLRHFLNFSCGRNKPIIIGTFELGQGEVVQWQALVLRPLQYAGCLADGEFLLQSYINAGNQGKKVARHAYPDLWSILANNTFDRRWLLFVEGEDMWPRLFGAHVFGKVADDVH